jgi:hypothetical protein
VGSIGDGGVGNGWLAYFELDAGEGKGDGNRKRDGEVGGAGRGEASADEAEIRDLFGAAFEAQNGRLCYFRAALSPNLLVHQE